MHLWNGKTRVNFKYELYDKDNDKLFWYSRAFLILKGVVMSLIMIMQV